MPGKSEISLDVEVIGAGLAALGAARKAAAAGRTAEALEELADG